MLVFATFDLSASLSSSTNWIAPSSTLLIAMLFGTCWMIHLSPMNFATFNLEFQACCKIFLLLVHCFNPRQKVFQRRGDTRIIDIWIIQCYTRDTGSLHIGKLFHISHTMHKLSDLHQLLNGGVCLVNLSHVFPIELWYF